MVYRNSLDVYTSLYRRLVADIADCYADSEPVRDWNKIQSRLGAEGISFLTKSLPRLGKAFDKALQGEIPFLSEGFKTFRCRPLLFGYLFERIFTSCGYVRSDADVDAIRHVRQLLYFMYKLELPYEAECTEKVLSNFVSIETEIETLSLDPSDAVIKRARSFITRVLGTCCPRDIIPKHGPGAVSTREVGGEKSHFSRIYEQLDEVYPFTEYFHFSATHTADRLDTLADLTPEGAGTAKVVLVPKDSRGPRLISCEPLEYQWIQQGQQRKLVSRLESHRLTKGHVNFTCQEVNRRLALESSSSRKMVTLDMKDASDRVTLALVNELFSGTEWAQALSASRSTSTILPNGQRVYLAKFAPMGSAVCFPVEALVFYALAVSAIVVHKQKRERVARESVYVYGDDIICDREDYPIVMQELERFGLLFNRDKCCVSGLFRESCGCDAYNGVDVTPIRLRKTWYRTKEASRLVSYVELSNSLYARGYYQAAGYVEHLVEDLYGPLPYVTYYRSNKKDDSPIDLSLQESFSRERKKLLWYSRGGRVIGFHRPDVVPTLIHQRKRIRTRFCRDTHVPQVQGYSVEPTKTWYGEDEWEKLLRRYTCGRVSTDAGLYADAHSSRLKRNWGNA